MPVYFRYLIIVSLLLFSFCGQAANATKTYSLVKTSFYHLPDWQDDNHADALLAFKKSCQDIARFSAKTRFGAAREAGTTGDWQKICNAIAQLKSNTDKAAREFFEKWFEPYHVVNNVNDNSLFTGYYLPTINASLKKTDKFKEPIYGIPSDLVRVNLGTFHPKFAGQYVTGRWQGHTFTPYPTRKAIINGAIHEATKVIAWSDSLIDLFFAQIQGSALVNIKNGPSFIIGYAASNGHAYTSIGRVLVDKGILAKEEVSMNTIRAWLDKHPEKVHHILDQNASFVFFRVLNGDAPLGTEQVPLTPHRSLAVDTRVIPLGAPVWLDTRVPKYKNKDQPLTFRHLLIAQDTGGAIKGIRRGDVYWGTGDKAAFYAGHMQSPGEYWVLLPKG